VTRSVPSRRGAIQVVRIMLDHIMANLLLHGQKMGHLRRNIMYIDVSDKQQSRDIRAGGDIICTSTTYHLIGIYCPIGKIKKQCDRT